MVDVYLFYNANIRKNCIFVAYLNSFCPLLCLGLNSRDEINFNFNKKLMADG